MPYNLKEIPYPFRCGVDYRNVPNLHQLINDLDMQYDFALVNVCNLQNFRDQNTMTTRDIALTRSGKSPDTPTWKLD